MAKKKGKRKIEHAAANDSVEHVAPAAPSIKYLGAIALAIIAIAIIFSAFASPGQPGSPPSQMPGSDRDSHGCISSAG